MAYNYSRYEDIDLLEMIRARNDEVAFREIYLRYANPLFQLAFRKTDSKEVAEDIVQITFIKLWSGRNNLKLNHSLKAYLYASAKNNIITYYLRQLSKKTISLEFVEEELPVQCNTEDHMDYYDTLELYHESLQELPDKCREVFMLSRQGYSLKEIAAIRNISPKTAEVHISKALRYLRRILKITVIFFLGYTFF